MATMKQYIKMVLKQQAEERLARVDAVVMAAIRDLVNQYCEIGSFGVHDIKAKLTEIMTDLDAE